MCNLQDDIPLATEIPTDHCCILKHNDVLLTTLITKESIPQAFINRNVTEPFTRRRTFSVHDAVESQPKKPKQY